MGFFGDICHKVKSWFTSDVDTTKQAPNTADPKTTTSPNNNEAIQSPGETSVDNQANAPPSKLETNSQQTNISAVDVLEMAKSKPELLDQLQDPAQAQLIKNIISDPVQFANAQQILSQQAGLTVNGQANFDASQFSSPRISVVADSGVGSQPRVIELKLDNGIRVLLMPDDHANQVDFRAVYSVGSNQDIKPGTAHMLEHLLGSRVATKTFKPRECDDIVTYNGGTANAGIDRDFTYYYSVLAPELLELAFKIESERRKDVDIDSLDNKVLDVEKSAMASEIDLRNDNATRLLYDHAIGLAYPNSEYNNNVMGTKESVRSITRDDLKAFYQQYQDPNKLTLVVSGNLGNPAKFEHLLLKYFGEAPGSYQAPLAASKQQQEPKKVDPVILKPGEDKMLCLAYKGPNLTHDDALVFDIVCRALMLTGPHSRFNKELGEDEKISFGVSQLEFSQRNGQGLMGIIVGVKRIIDLNELKIKLKKVLKDIADNGLEEEELARIKTIVMHEHIGMQEQIVDQSSDLVEHDQQGSWQSYTGQTNKIQAITNQDIMRVVKKYCTDDNEVTAFLMPTDKEEKDATSVQQPVEQVEEPEADPVRLQELTDAICGKQTISPPQLQLQESPGVKINEDHRLPIANICMKAPIGPFSHKEQLILGLLMRVLFESGTETLNKEQFFDKLNSVGSNVIIFFDRDGVYFGLPCVTRSDNLKQTLSLFKDILLNAKLDFETFALLKATTMDALKRENENLGAVINRELYHNLYKDVNNPHHMLSREDRWQLLDSITYQDLINVWHKISKAQFTIGAAGDIKQQDIAELQSILKQWSEQKPRNLGDSLTAAHSSDIAELEGHEYKATQEQAHVALGQDSKVRSTDKDFYALLLAEEILGNGLDSCSRLFRIVRASQGQVYALNTNFDANVNSSGTFTIQAQTQKGNGDRVLASIQEALTNFPDDITEAELQNVKQKFIKEYIMENFDTRSSKAHTLLNLGLRKRDKDFIKNFPTMIESIGLDDVKNAIKKHIDLKNMTTVVVDNDIKVNGKVVDTKFDAKAYKAAQAASQAPVAPTVQAASQLQSSGQVAPGQLVQTA